MRDAALRLLHVLGDLAAEADDLDLLVLPARRRGAVRDAAAIVEQIGVEIGVADAVARNLHLRKIDAEIAGAGADGGRGRSLAALGLRVDPTGAEVGRSRRLGL